MSEDDVPEHNLELTGLDDILLLYHVPKLQILNGKMNCDGLCITWFKVHSGENP